MINKKCLSLLPLILFFSLPSLAEFNVDAEVAKYLSTLTGEKLAKSNAYFEGKYWIHFWDLLIGCLIAVLFLQTKLSAKLRDISKKITRFEFVNDLSYTGMYVLVATILGLPFSFYVGYIREHQYELSNLSLAGWFSETGKGLMVGIVITSLFIPILYKIIRRFKKTWWLGGALLSISFMMIINFVFPVFLAPIFNDYKPLEQGPLKKSLLSLARANGINADNIYMFDASKQSKRISANVSGLFGTTRISLNDNLLNRSSHDEILAVMGHEMGHYSLNHTYEIIIYFGILILMGFYFIYWVFNNLFIKSRTQWNINSTTDIALLPLLFVTISLFFFVISPISNSIIRSNEVEADLYGLNSARKPDGFASIAIMLSEYRKISPGKWEEILFHDHPSGENRVRMAMTWKKENLNSQSSSSNKDNK